MRFNSIKNQIIIPAVIIILISSIIFLYSLKKDTNNIYLDDLRNAAKHSKSDMENMIKFNLDYMAMIAEGLSSTTEIKKALKEKNRNALLNNRIILNLNSQGIKIHFHIPPGISFLRVWKPEAYKDNISKFRDSIRKIYKYKKPLKIIEIGRMGVGIRAIYPVFFDKNLVGSVEIFKTLKKLITERALYKKYYFMLIVQKLEAVKYFKKLIPLNKSFIIIYSNSEKMRDILKKEKDLNNLDNKVSNNILINKIDIKIGSNVKALLFIGTDITKFSVKNRRILLYNTLIILITIILFILLLVYLIREKIILPLKKITSNVSKIILRANIRENILIENIPENEIGTLVKAYSLLLKKLGDLFEFKETIEEDSSVSEVYDRIIYLIEKKLKVKHFSIYRVKNSKDKIELIYNTKEEDGALWCSREILIDPNLCRAKRIAKAVDSSVDYPGICPYFRGGELKHLCIPIYFQESVNSIIQLVYEKSERDQIESIKKELLIYIKEATPVLEAKSLMDSLKETVMRDPLTGIYNRRFLEEYSEHLVSTIDRNKETIGILMLDIDHFKAVNDRFGHDVGDFVLKGIVGVFHNTIRRSDMAFRYGGEEFLIILHDVKSRENAVKVAEKIRTNVEQSDFKKLAIKLTNITISIGVSIFPDDSENFWESVKFADIALYKAKETGRNKVIVFDDSMKNEEKRGTVQKSETK